MLAWSRLIVYWGNDAFRQAYVIFANELFAIPVRKLTELTIVGYWQFYSFWARCLLEYLRGRKIPSFNDSHSRRVDVLAERRIDLCGRQ